MKSWRVSFSPDLPFYRSRKLVVGRFLKEIIIELESNGQGSSGKEKNILFKGKAFPEALR